MGRLFKGVLLGLLLVPAAASAAPFSSMYVFGDSLSDNGNLYSLLGYPVSPPYYDGRFSNGPVAAERMADTLVAGGSTGSNFHDYAWGGAQTGTTALPPGIGTQTNQYLGAAGSADPTALYMVWGGPNDFVFGSNTYTQSVNNLKNALSSLVGAGAQHILVPNMPDLALTPDYAGTAQAGAAHDFTLGFNSLLASTLANLNGSLGTHIVGFDTYSLFNQVLADPTAFGFTNVADACFSGSYRDGVGSVCSNPSQYLFWDGFHPTAAGHQILADQMVASVVPEPATVLLMVAGLLFIGLQVRRGRV